MNEGYQCPTYCAIDHHHSAYFTGKGMIIDENQLGKRVKNKKSRKKIKRWHIYCIVTILIGV